LINNTLKADGPWTWHRNEVVEASGAYNWDTTNINAGSYAITVLAFDEHGATNGPSISTVPVNVAVPELPIIPNFNPSPAPRQYPPSQHSLTPQQNNQSSTPPAIPPPANPPAKQQDLLAQSFPLEYVYGTVVSIVATIAVATGYLYSKRKK
jgi:hypothetical protein